jgi:transposase
MTPVYAVGDRRTLMRLRRLRSDAHGDKAPRVALRLQALMLSVQKHTNTEIARLLQVSRSRVHEWVCSWNQYGLEGILEGHRSGRPSALTHKQQTQLQDIIESGPIAYGLGTGVWTSPIIAKVIEDEFDIQYHPGHVRKILKSLRLSVQRPTTRLAAADPKAQRKWIRYTYPNLKKKPGQKTRQ